MPTFHLNKLVRAKLPRICKELGQTIESKRIVGKELELALISKLHEEVAELEATGRLEPKELADILQVVRDSAIASGSSPEELETLRLEREKDRGPLVVVKENGIPTGVYLSKVVCQEDDPWTTYYRQEPERFPEEITSVA